jgi:molybdopterin converting factor small subunit
VTAQGRPAGADVVVVLPAVLRDDAGGVSTVTVTVPATVRPTVRAVLDALSAEHPRLERRLRDERGGLRRHVNVFVGMDDTRGLLGQDTVVAPGAEVLLLPNIAGG